mmetsp:Transcript_52987/g.113673  ORF Transcript_52987/g.113673 Transcript_52987/m.113673 type:complete len:323 (+) Transcript_52987:676-1644(+)
MLFAHLLSLALQGIALLGQLLGIALRLQLRRRQLLLESAPLARCHLGSSERTALAGEALGAHLRGCCLEALQLRARGVLRLVDNALLRLDLMLATFGRAEVLESRLSLPPNAHEFLLRGPEILLQDRPLTHPFLQLALHLLQLRPLGVQLRARGALAVCCLLAPFHGLALHLAMPLHCGLHRAPCGRDTAGSRLEGCAPGSGEGNRRHLLQHATQVTADALDGLSGSVIVGVKPLLPSVQHLHELLVRKPCILYSHEGLLPCQGLLELLPVLPAHSFVAHGALLPLRLQCMALVSEHHVQGLISERQPRPAWHRPPRRKVVE